MLNRFRVGECLDSDIKMMKDRIFNLNDSRIPEQKLYIFGWNSEVNDMNSACLDAIEGELIVSQATVEQKSLKSFNPPTDKSGNIQNTNLQRELKFKVGSKADRGVESVFVT